MTFPESTLVSLLGEVDKRPTPAAPEAPWRVRHMLYGRHLRRAIQIRARLERRTPGEILYEEFMKPLGVSINALAREIAGGAARAGAFAVAACRDSPT